MVSVPGGMLTPGETGRTVVVTGRRPSVPLVNVPCRRRRAWWRFALIVSAGVAVSAVLVFGPQSPALFLPSLPVTLAAALFGWRDGAALAGGCAAAVLGPAIHGLAVSPVAERTGGVGLLPLLIWAAMLVTTGLLVGCLAEHIGNQRLLKVLAARTSAAVERERKRVSYDIHDGIAQEAATALMETEILRSLCTRADEEMQEQVVRIRDTLAALLKETRGMIGQLRPPPLDAAQFSTTLHRLVEDFGDRTGITTDMVVSGDFALHTDSMRICVYRVTQEALSNIEHHADASHVFVSIRAVRAGVYMDISDDGVGFDPLALASLDQDHQVGFKGIQDRVANLSGRLEVISSPGVGTTIRAFCPGYDG